MEQCSGHDISQAINPPAHRAGHGLPEWLAGLDPPRAHRSAGRKGKVPSQVGASAPIRIRMETREQWLGQAIEMMRPEFVAAGAPLPENLAVSCSWPSGNPRTVIGECWVAEASSRGYVEVFISPVLDQVAGIQGVLVTLRHELVHAAGRR